MAKPDSRAARMREICLALPDSRVTITWGQPHYRVGDKIFAGCGEEDGRVTLGFKLEKPHARELIARDPRFKPAPYVGAHGWVAMDASGPVDWDAVRGWVLESWRLIAPAKSLAKLGLEAPPSKRSRKTRARH